MDGNNESRKMATGSVWFGSWLVREQYADTSVMCWHCLDGDGAMSRLVRARALGRRACMQGYKAVWRGNAISNVLLLSVGK
jgi:hypothetical protein